MWANEAVGGKRAGRSPCGRAGLGGVQAAWGFPDHIRRQGFFQEGKRHGGLQDRARLPGVVEVDARLGFLTQHLKEADRRAFVLLRVCQEHERIRGISRA